MKFAEFFAGIGLVRMGLEMSGWKCEFANDIDPKKLEMYKAQFTDWQDHFKLGDIRAIDPLVIPAVDLATASFPCTDLSLAGARAGLGGQHSSALWPFLEVLHKIDLLRPKLILLENVTGFLSSNGGADLKSALIALNRLGYAVDAVIVDASHFVPQSRPRLFVIGSYEPQLLMVKERVKIPSFFESEHRPSALAKFILQNGDVFWKVRELPNLPREKHKLDSILESLPDESSAWWSKERAEYLMSQMSEKHSQIATKMIDGTKQSTGTIFRRVRNGKSMAELRVDGTAGCLRTPKGGSGRQILLVAGNGQYKVRLLTARECARLMGADHYKLDVPLNQALFGFGDAVCVPVIDWLARNYLNLALAETQELTAPLTLR